MFVISNINQGATCFYINPGIDAMNGYLHINLGIYVTYAYLDLYLDIDVIQVFLDINWFYLCIFRLIFGYLCYLSISRHKSRYWLMFFIFIYDCYLYIYSCIDVTYVCLVLNVVIVSNIKIYLNIFIVTTVQTL